MPDTQSWAANHGGRTLETWRSVADALCRQRARFAMVLHTGDMVGSPRLQPERWSNVAGHWLGQQREAWQRVLRREGPPLIALHQNHPHLPDLAAWGVVVELDPASGAVCVWSENLLRGNITHPAASWQQVGQVRAELPRRCFGGA
jgi:hypothetical protein